MLPGRQGEFEEWLRPARYDSPDPRFEVRRALPSEYEHIYPLVDAAFGVRRPRAVYDWLYQRNPRGRALCWIVVERSSGRLLAAVAGWPWPLARGDEGLYAMLTGDSVVHPDFQRLGVGSLRYAGWETDPLADQHTVVGWPNEISVSWLQKQGHDARVLGPLAEATADVSSRSPGRWLRSLSRSSRARRAGLRVVDVDRFDAEFDAVTLGCARWEGVWSAPDHDFLNWRYPGHPAHSYRMLALREGERLVAWTVLREEGRNACLMAFAAPRQGQAAPLLLGAALDAAREAGCRRLSVFAPPVWRHWPTLRRSGFSGRPCTRHMYLTLPPGSDLRRLDVWELLPGDTDGE
jgi:hypothetical protein